VAEKEPEPPKATVAPKPPTPVPSKPASTTPAPTIALKTSSAPLPGGPAAPAPTIKLATSTKPFAPATATPISTKPGMPAAASGTATLPKATVNLQPPTQPLSAVGGASAASTEGSTPTEFVSEEVSATDKVVTGLAIVGFVAACAVLTFQLMIAGVWIKAEDNESESGWMQLIE